MLRRLLVLVLVVMGLLARAPAGLGAAGPWYVSPAGDDGNDCLSWDTACATVASAVAKSAPGETVYLAAGTYPESELFLEGDHLVGAGAATTVIDAEGEGQVMYSVLEASITGLTLRGGLAGSGGGIANDGTLTINASRIVSNTATSSGGGIYNSGTLLLLNSLVSGNSVSATVGFEGGIANRGQLTLRGSTIESNSSPYIGGLGNGSSGISATADIANSAIISNTATAGYTGGLHNVSVMTLTNVTISGNSAAETGGGIGVTLSSTLYVLNSTIANNQAAGGALYSYSDQVTLKNTLLAGNAPTNCGFGIGGDPNSAGYNLSSDASCALGGPGDNEEADPLLGPLAYNLGSTLTHAIPGDSPAANTGTNDGCPPTDQRGFARPFGAACDIGAFEFVELTEVLLPAILR